MEKRQPKAMKEGMEQGNQGRGGFQENSNK